MLRKFELIIKGKPSKWSRNSRYIVFSRILSVTLCSLRTRRAIQQRESTIIMNEVKISTTRSSTMLIESIWNIIQYLPIHLSFLRDTVVQDSTSSFVPRVTRNNIIFHVEGRSIPPAIAKSLFSYSLSFSTCSLTNNIAIHNPFTWSRGNVLFAQRKKLHSISREMIKRFFFFSFFFYKRGRNAAFYVITR